MKLNMIELRDMIATAVRQTIREAKKAKLPASRSEESIAAARARQLTGLPGYSHGNVLDMSKPLGKRNLAKRQGKANMGNWTSEARLNEVEDDSEGDANATHAHLAQGDFGSGTAKLADIIDTLTSNGMPHAKAVGVARELISKMSNGMVDPAKHELDNPSELGIESQYEAIKHLVRAIVAEEIRVTGRRRRS